VKRQLILWTIAVLVTIVSARYQRITGPTYAKEGEVQFEGNKITFKLDRSHPGADNHKVFISVPDTSISGYLIYKRFKSYDSLTESKMIRDGQKLVSEFPGQPAAGKVEYQIKLTKGLSFVNIPPEPVVLRFRGDVPAGVLIPHIIFISFAMLLSTRTGMEAFFKDTKLKGLVLWTVGILFLGGLLFGPIVQKFSFGEYWTGFPFGFDLTDNKTLIAFLSWMPALYLVIKNKSARKWVIGAAIITFIIFLIPHSVLGSEIDHTKLSPKTEIQIK
jgi:hypothetical protein